MRALLQAEWADADEQMRTVQGGENERGHLGASIGGRSVVPYQPSGPVPELDVDFGRLSPASRFVRAGKFHGDEWIHDPAMRGWVYAATTDQLAVRCADHLAAAGPEGWFASTDRRLGVVVDPSVVAKPNDVPEPEAREQKRGGVGSFLGKARTALGAVAEFSEGFTKSGPQFVVLWECSIDSVADDRMVGKGRSTIPYQFLRVDFVDGSALELNVNIHALI
ncbi:hypothetical protein [Saccharopolyspora pogona]|uniref:hypothetical protein n=1 Tax=Saccharopolyspora pogona TaxID=333966 RepID=UPI001681CF08|nr:hypothetical protein [Saccharopolyspora pogona]